MPVLATGQFIQSFCLHYMVTHGISYNPIYKVLPWDGQLQQYSLYKTGFLLILKLFGALLFLAAMLDDCIIKTISFDAESREEQDGSMHLFVGQTMAEL